MKYSLSASLSLLALLVAPAAALEMPVGAGAYEEPGERAVGELAAGDEDPDADACAAEEDLEEAEVPISPAAQAALEQARIHTESMADMLASVVDAASANLLAPRISAAYEALKNTDFSSLAVEDEELLAAEYAEELVARLDAELERLSEAGFYGNLLLQQLFGGPVEPADTLPSQEKNTTPGKEVDVPALEAGTESVSS